MWLGPPGRAANPLQPSSTVKEATLEAMHVQRPIVGWTAPFAVLEAAHERHHRP